MRRILAAALLMSPAVLHAQASKQLAGLNLEARTYALEMAMPAVDGAAATSAIADTAMLRVSTGVLAAKVIHSTQIAYSANELNPNSNANRVVVKVLVNENGLPQDAKIVSSLNPQLNLRVLEAVQHYRFQPAQLDQQAVPQQVNLAFDFQR
jgi:TonB family protein